LFAIVTYTEVSEFLFMFLLGTYMVERIYMLYILSRIEENTRIQEQNSKTYADISKFTIL